MYEIVVCRSNSIESEDPDMDLKRSLSPESKSVPTVPVNGSSLSPAPLVKTANTIKVLTPLSGDSSVISLPIDSCPTISHVLSNCLNYLKIPSHELSPYFALFSLIETDSKPSKFFPRLSNDQTLDSLVKPGMELYLRKRIVSKKLEKYLCDHHSTFTNFVFHQAKADIKSGLLEVDDPEMRQKLTESFKLKSLSDTVDLLHEIESYNDVTFPHCMSSVQKENPLKMSVSSDAVYLKICDQKGEALDFDCVTCKWDVTRDWRVEHALEEPDSGKSAQFCFEFTRPNGKSKTVKLFSEFAPQMLMAFESVSAEKKILNAL